jgi:hypothetical protein
MSTIVAYSVHWVITFLGVSEKWSMNLQDTPSTFARQQNTLWFQNQGVNTLWSKKIIWSSDLILKKYFCIGQGYSGERCGPWASCSRLFHIGTWNFLWGFSVLRYTSSSHFIVMTPMVLEFSALGFFTIGHMHVTVTKSGAFSDVFHHSCI